MDIVQGFFSFLFQITGFIGTILGIWSVIRSPEEVKTTLESWFRYFQDSNKTNQIKQTKDMERFSKENFSKIIDSVFDSPREVVIKSEMKLQPKRQPMNYLYILAVLIFVPIVLTLLVSKPAYIPEPEIVSPPPEIVPPFIDWNLTGGMNILSLFWMYVCLFGIIGAMRGWAKEILIIFSSVVALAVNLLLSKYFPFVKDLSDNNISLFWIQSIILFVLVYFGYQTVISIPRLGSRAVRERLQDSLLGAMLGGINGYFIAGSILSYFHKAEYPYPNVIAPATDTNFLEMINRMIEIMPPNLLGEPGIYFAVVIMLAFIFVIYI